VKLERVRQLSLAPWYLATTVDGFLAVCEDNKNVCPRLAQYILEDESSTVPHAWCIAHSAHIVDTAILPFL